MRIADSGFLLALFLSGDRNFAAAEREATRPGAILIVTEVLSESLGVLQKRKGVDFARLVHEWILSRPFFQFVFTQRAQFDVASRLFAKSPERLNFVDCVLVAHATATKFPVLTFDDDLRKALRREAS